MQSMAQAGMMSPRIPGFGEDAAAMSAGFGPFMQPPPQFGMPFQLQPMAAQMPMMPPMHMNMPPPPPMQLPAPMTPPPG